MQGFSDDPPPPYSESRSPPRYSESCSSPRYSGFDIPTAMPVATNSMEGESLSSKLAELERAGNAGLMSPSEVANARQRIIDSFAPSAAASGREVRGPRRAVSGLSLVLVDKRSPTAVRLHDPLSRSKQRLVLEDGRVIGLAFDQPKDAWGEWGYIDLMVGEEADQDAALWVDLDDRGFITWNDATFGEFVFDVSMWKLVRGNHLVLVQGKGIRQQSTKTHRDSRGRLFKQNRDGTISPSFAEHLALGVEPLIPTANIAGCWFCCCFPFGFAIFHKRGEGDDHLIQSGCLLSPFPAPFVEGRTRHAGSNGFFKDDEPHNVDLYVAANCVHNGPSFSVKLCDC